MSQSVHYKCAACGGEFDSERSDEDALAESKRLWGDLPASALTVICDDCFQRGLPKARMELRRRKPQQR